MPGFSRDIARTLATQVAIVGLNAGVGVLTARALGPADRGVYSLCMAIMLTTMTFAGFELGQSVVFHVGRNRASSRAIAGGALLVSTALGLAAVLLLLFGWPALSRAFASVPADAFRIALPLIPLMMANAAMRHVFRSLNRFDAYNALHALSPVLRLVLLAAAFALGGGVAEALGAVVAAELLTVSVSLAVLARVAAPSMREGIAWIASLLRFGGRVEASTAMGYANVRIGLLVVGATMAPAEIAFFAIADALVQQLLTFPTVVGTVLLPRIVGRREATAASMTAAAHRAMLLVSGALVIGLAVLAQPVILALYGRDYAPSVLPLLALLPGVLFRSGTRVIGTYVVAANQLGAWVIVAGASLAAHALLLWLLIPRFGTLGAGAAASLTFALQWVAALLLFGRVSGLGVTASLRVGSEDVRRIVESARSGLRGGAPPGDR